MAKTNGIKKTYRAGAAHWRKLHLAVDEKYQLLACELTTPETGDPTAVPDLLSQIESEFDAFMGDGAYDGDPVYQAVLAKQPDAAVIISPHNSAMAQGNEGRQVAIFCENLKRWSRGEKMLNEAN